MFCPFCSFFVNTKSTSEPPSALSRPGKHGSIAADGGDDRESPAEARPGRPDAIAARPTPHRSTIWDHTMSSTPLEPRQQRFRIYWPAGPAFLSVCLLSPTSRCLHRVSSLETRRCIQREVGLIVKPPLLGTPALFVSLYFDALAQHNVLEPLSVGE